MSLLWSCGVLCAVLLEMGLANPVLPLGPKRPVRLANPGGSLHTVSPPTHVQWPLSSIPGPDTEDELQHERCGESTDGLEEPALVRGFSILLDLCGCCWHLF